jgi:hypothetical protein
MNKAALNDIENACEFMSLGISEEKKDEQEKVKKECLS